MYLGNDPGMSGVTHQWSAGTYRPVSSRVAPRDAKYRAVRFPLHFQKFSCCAESNPPLNVVPHLGCARKCTLCVKSRNKSNRRTGVPGC